MSAMPSINISQFNRLCRTCLSVKRKLYSIFLINISNTTLAHVISTLTGIKVEPNDDVPTSVCYECKEKATISYDFIRQCRESEAVLCKLIKSDTTHPFEVDIKEDLQVNIKGVKEENEDEICSVIEFGVDYSPMSDSDDEYYVSDFIKKEAKKDVAINCEKKSDHKQKDSTMKAENTDSSYCPLCGERLESRLLAIHMKEKHKELMRPTKKSENKKGAYDALIQKLSKNGLIIKNLQKCTICKKLLKEDEDLTAHLWEVHKDEKLFKCVRCNRMFLKKIIYHLCKETKNRNEQKTKIEPSGSKRPGFLETSIEDILRNIDNLNTSKLPQACSICSEVFLSYANLKNHENNEHLQIDPCNICLETFSSMEAAIKHKLTCKIIKRSYQCSTCNRTFAFEESLKHHNKRCGRNPAADIANVAAQKKTFQCDICNKVYYYKNSIINHISVRHSVSTKVYECDICQKPFFRKDNMKSHRRIHGNRIPKPKSRVCPICGMSFTNSALSAHLRRHNGERPHKCTYCSKDFTRLTDMKRHINTHTGVRPYVCSYCGKCFARNTQLKVHVRVHTKQKPYKCTFCERAFSQSNDLTLHIRRHTGEKPFVCEICGEAFIQGTALKKHRIKVKHFSPESSITTSDTVTQNRIKLDCPSGDRTEDDEGTVNITAAQK